MLTYVDLHSGRVRRVEPAFREASQEARRHRAIYRARMAMPLLSAQRQKQRPKACPDRPGIAPASHRCLFLCNYIRPLALREPADADLQAWRNRNTGAVRSWSTRQSSSPSTVRKDGTCRAREVPWLTRLQEFFRPIYVPKIIVNFNFITPRLASIRA
jgi:hypothetical protein